jgi:phosphatidylglycerol:prolipoprotein diacylglycerol transferase
MALGRVGCFLNGCCYGGECDLPWAVTFPMGSPPYIDQAQNGKLPVHGLLLANDLHAPPIIESVEPGSAAAESGVRASQRIRAVNEIEVRTAEDARYALMRVDRPGMKLSLTTDDDPAPKQWSVPARLARSLPIHPAQLYSTIDALLLCLFLIAYTPFKTRDGEITALTLTLHPISRFLLEIIRIDEKAVFNTGWSISQNISVMILIGAVICWLIVLTRKRGTYWPTGTSAPQAARAIA